MHLLQGLSLRKLLLFFLQSTKRKGKETFMTLIGTSLLNGVIVFMRERNYTTSQSPWLEIYQTKSREKSWYSSNSQYLVGKLCFFLSPF